MLLVEDKADVANSEERAICQQLRNDFHSLAWDGLRDHHKRVFSDSLWRKVYTDKMNCLGRNCQFYQRCPFFIARRDIEDADAVPPPCLFTVLEGQTQLRLTLKNLTLWALYAFSASH